MKRVLASRLSTNANLQLALAGFAAATIEWMSSTLGFVSGSPIVGSAHTTSLLSLGFVVYSAITILPPFIGLLTGYAILRSYRYEFASTAAMGGVALAVIVGFIVPKVSSAAVPTAQYVINVVIEVLSFLFVGWLLRRQMQAVLPIKITAIVLLVIVALISFAAAAATFFAAQTSLN